MKDHYPVFILWSEDDECFLANVVDLPGCIADGKTREAALANAEGMAKDWIETAKALGRKIPRPSANVRDQVSPLAFGATPCASKDRDESPAGMGINCIALFAFSVFELRIAQLVLVIVGCLIVIWVLGKSLFEHYRELNSRKNKEDNREQK